MKSNDEIFDEIIGEQSAIEEYHVINAYKLGVKDGKSEATAALSDSLVVQCQSVLIKNAERLVKAETALKLMPYTRHLDFCKMDMPVEPRCTCGFEKIVDELTD